MLIELPAIAHPVELSLDLSVEEVLIDFDHGEGLALLHADSVVDDNDQRIRLLTRR